MKQESNQKKYHPPLEPKRIEISVITLGLSGGSGKKADGVNSMNCGNRGSDIDSVLCNGDSSFL